MKDLLKKQWKLIIIVLIFFSVFFIFYNKISFSEPLISPPVVTDSITYKPLISSSITLDSVAPESFTPEPLISPPVVIDSITPEPLISPPVVTDSNTLDSFNASTVQIKTNLPIRLKIPAINVDALIEHVGLTSTGKMDEPKNAKNVAWFNLGTLPGAEGSAVIAGHLDDKSGRRAVFYDLKKVSKGDQLFIEDSLGQIITFVVKEIRMYNSEAFAPEIFISSGGSHLNLITCAGTWSKSEKKYTERLVVFTEQIIQQ